MRPLFWLRQLPAWQAGKPSASLPSDQLFVDLALDPASPWVQLGEEPDQELVMGAIGSFAQPVIAFVRMPDVATYRAFADPLVRQDGLEHLGDPGWRLGAGLHRDHGVTHARTRPAAASAIQRLLVADQIKPFDGLMVWQGLPAIKRLAERAAGVPPDGADNAYVRERAIGAVLVAVGLVYLWRRSSSRYRG